MRCAIPRALAGCSENLARRLEFDHPGAAASLREGLEETLPNVPRLAG
jgi:hypothetical protein